MISMQNLKIFEIQSEFCRAIANSKRLRILNEIEKGQITVSDIAKSLNLPISNISQHLRIMKDSEIVKTHKTGQKVYYSVTDQRIIDMCRFMREIISDLFEKRMDIFNENMD